MVETELSYKYKNELWQKQKYHRNTKTNYGRNKNIIQYKTTNYGRSRNIINELRQKQKYHTNTINEFWQKQKYHTKQKRIMVETEISYKYKNELW